jgi:hypothetical protein
MAEKEYPPIRRFITEGKLIGNRLKVVAVAKDMDPSIQARPELSKVSFLC